MEGRAHSGLFALLLAETQREQAHDLVGESSFSHDLRPLSFVRCLRASRRVGCAQCCEEFNNPVPSPVWDEGIPSALFTFLMKSAAIAFSWRSISTVQMIILSEKTMRGVLTTFEVELKPKQ